MRRRAYALILVTCALLASPAGAVDVNPVSSLPTVGPDGLIVVDLIASGLGDGSAPSIGGYDLDLSFDPALVSLQDVAFSGNLDVNGLGSVTSFTPGASTVNLFEVSLDPVADLDALQAPTITLASLTFRVAPSIIEGLALFSIAGTGVSDARGAVLPVTLGSASVVITPEPGAGVLVLMGLSILASRRRRENRGNATDPDNRLGV